ncbi:MAG TPA: orotidine-5'-phosphate decarboxylase [Burkholderiales bacterium]|nr:orotidine-5'-phosphate decarboxylase [Burkholderiales bacterium]
MSELPPQAPGRRERLIVALDLPSAAEARALVERIGEAACFYKIGLELFTSGGAFELLEWLVARGNKVFADLKLYDIPETVRRAVANLRSSGASFLTVHGQRSILEAAAGEKGALKILAVTVLTSFDASDLAEMGPGADVGKLVSSRARHALEAGCDGVICSGLEAPAIRAQFGQRLLVVTPGIRPAGNRPGDDQKRTVDVAQAFANGADYIVVGRPVRDAADPRAAAEAIQATIGSVFAR